MVVGTVVQITKKVVEESVKVEVGMGEGREQQKATEIVVVERGVDEVPVAVHSTAKNKGKKTVNGEEIREENTEKKKKRRKRGGSSAGVASGGYKRYVFRVLKQVHPGLTVSARAMSVLDGMMCDMFERIAEAAAQLSKYTGKATLSSKAVQDAVRLVVPGELGRHAIAEGMKAVKTYLKK